MVLGKPEKAGFHPFAMATGIGSMPHTDPADALGLVLACLPDAPHWPQLPSHGKSEQFVYQFLHPLVNFGLLFPEKDQWHFDTSRTDTADCMAAFYTACLAAEEGEAESLSVFRPLQEAAAGYHMFLDRIQAGSTSRSAYVKGQVSGPVTVGLGIKDQEGKAAYYDENLRDMIVRTLALNARCQTETLSKHGNQPMIFIDDPGVSAYGTHLHLGLSRQMVLDDLNAVCTAIQSAGGIPGIHACDAIDWSLILASKAEIMSLDAYRSGRSLLAYTKPLLAYIENGGVIAWGIVPTLDDIAAETVGSLTGKLAELWDDIFPGVDRSSIVQQSMITPSCGTGLLSSAQAERIYRLTADVSLHLQKHLCLL